MKFPVACPCSPANQLFLIGPDSYAEFTCDICGKKYYAKSLKEGFKINPVKRIKPEHGCSKE